MRCLHWAVSSACHTHTHIRTHARTHLSTHNTHTRARARVCAFLFTLRFACCVHMQLESGQPLPDWSSTNLQTFWKLWAGFIRVRAICTHFTIAMITLVPAHGRLVDTHTHTNRHTCTHTHTHAVRCCFTSGCFTINKKWGSKAWGG